MNHPLIYGNGCSYSDPHWHPDVNEKTHVEYVGEMLGGFVLNKAISGSCNRRILRTSLYDIIEQRRCNPEQKIIALISLTFEMRGDLWVDDATVIAPEESHFVSHHFTSKQNWKELLLNGKSIDDRNSTIQDTPMLQSRFASSLRESRAFFFSPYAERINLLADLVMFTAVCKKHNIQYLIFQGPKAEQLGEEHLLDFFKAEVSADPRIFDLETFGLCNWANNNNYVPIDDGNSPREIGHYGNDAHKAFAEQILIPKLKETQQL